ncbi:unnamed protein product [Gongylonema pulchrum]|uniref:Kinase n=1 Tax=Gongylonema pulchrum TaxID=637853 RepID=A0A183DS05_9BILA|nr:unnamed protein product [Gongylonema pulchrum]
MDQQCSMLLPESYEWYREQIAGHHPSVIKNGVRQIGLFSFPPSGDAPGADIRYAWPELAIFWGWEFSQCLLVLFDSMKFFRNQRSVLLVGLIKQIGTETLMKPVQRGVRGACEREFYLKLARQRASSDGSEESAVLKRFLSFTPAFFGIKSVWVGYIEVECLVLEDLASRYKYPCIMDIKVGKVTYDPQATQEKRLSEAVKYPEQTTLGFRLTGYRNVYRELSVEWGTFSSRARRPSNYVLISKDTAGALPGSMGGSGGASALCHSKKAVI